MTRRLTSREVRELGLSADEATRAEAMMNHPDLPRVHEVLLGLPQQALADALTGILLAFSSDPVEYACRIANEHEIVKRLMRSRT